MEREIREDGSRPPPPPPPPSFHAFNAPRSIDTNITLHPLSPIVNALISSNSGIRVEGMKSKNKCQYRGILMRMMLFARDCIGREKRKTELFYTYYVAFRFIYLLLRVFTIINRLSIPLPPLFRSLIYNTIDENGIDENFKYKIPPSIRFQ